MSTQTEEPMLPPGWSPRILAIAGGLCLAMVLGVSFDLSAAVLLLPLLVVGFLVCGTGAVPVLLWRRRPRREVFHFVAVCAVTATMFALPAVSAAAQAIRFRSSLPRYEQLIAEKRAASPVPTPVRLVLEWRDRSLFVTSPLLEAIVYDETDGTLKDPCPVLDRGHCPAASHGDAEAPSLRFVVEPIERHC